MRRRYPHHLLITRSDAGGGTSPGVQNLDTGVLEPGGTDTTVHTDTVYDGPADVQDKGIRVPRDAEGRAKFTADAVAYLKPTRGLAWDDSQMPDIQPGDVALVTWNDAAGSTDDAQVREVARLDGSVWLERV